MNKKVLIIFAAVLALVLAMPLIAGLVSAPPPAPQKSSALQAPANTPTAPPTPAPQAPPPQMQLPAYVPPPQPAAPFQFDANTLAGTGWQVNTPYGTVQIFLERGGQLVATHPMVGQITGNWRAAGRQLTATISAFGQTQSIACEIRGDQLLYQGRPVQRIR